MRVALVIPCQNEEQALPQFLAFLLKEIESIDHEFLVILVSDHSTDATVEAARLESSKWAHKQSNMSLEVIESRLWKGKSYAQMAGAERAAGADLVIFMDGDGQHHPKYLRELIAKAGEGFSVVFGQRSTNYSRGALGKLGILVLRLIKRLVGIQDNSDYGEYLLVAGTTLNQLLRHPNFGVFPIGTVVISLDQRHSTIPIEIVPRLGIDKTNFKFFDLLKKGLYELVSEPWKFLGRVLVGTLALSLIFVLYGLNIGFTQMSSGTTSGVGSTIVLLVLFCTLNALISLVTLSTLVVFIQTYQRSKQRAKVGAFGEDG